MYIAIRYKNDQWSKMLIRVRRNKKGCKEMVIKGGAVMNMVAFGKKVVKFRIPILIISILLLIPAGLGYVNTRVNYDVLTYLPEDIETMQGQDILVKDFGTGAFSMFIVDGMEDKDVSALKAKIEKVDHVQKVLWYDSLADISMPKSMMPKDVYEVFNSDTGTMMAIFFDEGTSSDGTMEAIGEIRKLAGKQCFLSGMSAIVTDTKNLAEKETPLYVLIAVVLAVIVLGLTMDSYFIPLLFMLSIGMAIIYNLGSNYYQIIEHKVLELIETAKKYEIKIEDLIKLVQLLYDE